jgi:kinesin family protein 5
MFGPQNVDRLLKSEILDRLGAFKSKEIELLDSLNENSTPFGVVIRSFAEALRAKKVFEANGNVSLTLSMQYVEIYNEKTTDLLSGSNVLIRRGNGELVGASEVVIDTIADAVAALQAGGERKHFASTAMNERSSRSHTVIVLHLAQTQLATGAHQRSHLYLVDLAGSERVKKSKVVGEAFLEAKNINSSLLVLGRVIASLSRSGSHVPYYESQLTTLLKGVFGGNCKTSVVVTCRSDDSMHGDEILESLRFGEQCSMISNVARSAATSVSTVMKTLDDAIGKVEDQIAAMRERGLDQVPSFAALESKLADLRLKRDRVKAASLKTQDATATTPAALTKRK